MLVALACARPELAEPTRKARRAPFGAGGNTDNAARILAARFGSVFGQPCIVENHPGCCSSAKASR
jgi:tripartite-type tricarboxylate transporter receptor subunit TctC